MNWLIRLLVGGILLAVGSITVTLLMVKVDVGDFSKNPSVNKVLENLSDKYEHWVDSEKLNAEAERIGQRIYAGEWVEGDLIVSSKQEAQKAILRRCSSRFAGRMFRDISFVPEIARNIKCQPAARDFHAESRYREYFVYDKLNSRFTLKTIAEQNPLALFFHSPSLQTDEIKLKVLSDSTWALAVRDLQWSNTFNNLSAPEINTMQIPLEMLSKATAWYGYGLEAFVGILHKSSLTDAITVFGYQENQPVLITNDKKWDLRAGKIVELTTSTESVLATVQISAGTTVAVDGKLWSHSFDAASIIVFGPNQFTALLVQAHGKWNYLVNDHLLSEWFDEGDIFTFGPEEKMIAAVVGKRQTSGELQWHVIVRQVN